MVKGASTVEERVSSVLFTAEISFGTETPLLGNLLDTILHTFIGRRLKALEQHMVEEGRNLKVILEKDTQWKASPTLDPGAGQQPVEAGDQPHRRTFLLLHQYNDQDSLYGLS